MHPNRFRTGLAACTALLLAACGSIGEGNTVKTLEIIPATGTGDAVATYDAYRCLRDQFLLVGTFTNGSKAPFTQRAHWTSSDPAVLEVADAATNRVPVQIVRRNDNDTDPDPANDYKFDTLSGTSYSAGTLIPHQVSVTPVTITAEFVGLKASVQVTVNEVPSTLFVVANPLQPGNVTLPQPASSLFYVGQNADQNLDLLAVMGGRVRTDTSLNSGLLNPILWRFTEPSTLQLRPGDTTDLGDFDRFVLDDGSGNVVATLSPTSGLVSGFTPDAVPHEVQVELGLCADDPSPPGIAAQIEVLPVVAPPVLAHESAAYTGDLVSGTDELLKVTAQLDDDNDGLPDVEQDVSLQSSFGFDFTQDGINPHFQTAANRLIVRSTPTAEVPTPVGGDLIHACFPVYPTSTTLEAPVIAPGTRDVTLTADAVNANGAAVRAYVFGFGDGTATVTQDALDPTSFTTFGQVTHTYTKDGNFIPTVSALDSCGITSANFGGTLVALNTTPPGTVPEAALTATVTGGAGQTAVQGTAPLFVRFDASGSSDSAALYTFDFGDGESVTQVRTAATHVYAAAGSYPARVFVTTKSGDVSALSTTVTVNVAAPVQPIPSVLSNPLALNAVKATLTAVDLSITPDTEPAFSYPGAQLTALGTFTAVDEAIDPFLFSAGAPTTGQQTITRQVNWTVRPHGSTKKYSDLAVVRSQRDGLQREGQVSYLRNLNDDEGTTTVLDIYGKPVSGFGFGSKTTTPDHVELTVTECTSFTVPFPCP
ncbi:MAG TPA: PKD domain-containing protein [Candidatus Binatia bacterium]|nr:PKD domain-containing protein [Candidatus Binatia bacterium]